MTKTKYIAFSVKSGKEGEVKHFCIEFFWALITLAVVVGVIITLKLMF